MSQLELHPVLHSYLRMLAGPKPGRVDRYFDVRWRDDHARHGFGRQFVPANDLTRVARLVNQLAGWTDVYLPIMLRDRVFRRDAVTGHRYQVGDATAVSRSHLLWVDVDHEDAQARLDAFPHRPTVTVASGIICSCRSRRPTVVSDACWRRVADRARLGDGDRRRP